MLLISPFQALSNVNSPDAILTAIPRSWPAFALLSSSLPDLSSSRKGCTATGSSARKAERSLKLRRASAGIARVLDCAGRLSPDLQQTIGLLTDSQRLGSRAD